jgi:hypothetical protein
MRGAWVLRAGIMDGTDRVHVPSSVPFTCQAHAAAWTAAPHALASPPAPRSRLRQQPPPVHMQPHFSNAKKRRDLSQLVCTSHVPAGPYAPARTGPVMLYRSRA